MGRYVVYIEARYIGTDKAPTTRISKGLLTYFVTCGKIYLLYDKRDLKEDRGVFDNEYVSLTHRLPNKRIAKIYYYRWLVAWKDYWQVIKWEILREDNYDCWST